jgi:hypothetical protein
LIKNPENLKRSGTGRNAISLEQIFPWVGFVETPSGFANWAIFPISQSLIYDTISLI